MQLVITSQSAWIKSPGSQLIAPSDFLVMDGVLERNAKEKEGVAASWKVIFLDRAEPGVYKDGDEVWNCKSIDHSDERAWGSIERRQGLIGM